MGLLVLRGSRGKSDRFSCGIKHLGGLLVLRGYQQHSTEMAEEIGPGDAEFLLGEIPRQLREGWREHQRQDAALGLVGLQLAALDAMRGEVVGITPTPRGLRPRPASDLTGRHRTRALATANAAVRHKPPTADAARPLREHPDMLGSSAENQSGPLWASIPGSILASAEGLAQRLIEATCVKQGIGPHQLTIHADRGAPMRSKLVAELLSDLSIDASHSRPRVSNDNPFSEAQFRTFKYRPEFPDRFGSIAHGRSVSHDLFTWYNDAHHHSGLSYLTPADVHYGRAAAIIRARHRTRLAAYAAHPERFVQGPPRLEILPHAVWINPPAKSTGQDAPGATIVTPDDPQHGGISGSPLVIGASSISTINSMESLQ